MSLSVLSLHQSHPVPPCQHLVLSLKLSCNWLALRCVCYCTNLTCLCVLTDPGTAAVARLSRAEAYTALKQYKLALEDSEFCCATEPSAEVGRSRRSHRGDPTEPAAVPQQRPWWVVSFHFDLPR